LSVPKGFILFYLNCWTVKRGLEYVKLCMLDKCVVLPFLSQSTILDSHIFNSVCTSKVEFSLMLQIACYDIHVLCEFCT